MGLEAFGVAGWSFGLLGVAVFILAVFALVAVFRSSATIAMKVVWTIVIVVLPLLGSAIYFLVNGTGAPSGPDATSHDTRPQNEQNWPH
jgi:hypothetical protein